jgi:hypothetical protein
MTTPSRATLLATARRAMFNHLACAPDATATSLAEAAAITLGHDEWLDDPDHWIWVLALETLNLRVQA